MRYNSQYIFVPVIFLYFEGIKSQRLRMHGYENSGIFQGLKRRDRKIGNLKLRDLKFRDCRDLKTRN